MAPTDATVAAAPESAPPNQAETNARVARATGILVLGNVGSRALGMVREMALTGLFGATASVDAFYTATIIPKTLYDLLIAGHVNSAIIPVLSEMDTREGRAAFWQLVSLLLTLLTALLALIVLVLMAFAPQFVTLFGSGYGAPTLDLAAGLLRVTAPALIALGMFSVLSGAMYALQSFALPALAGVVFNGAIVLVTLFLTPPPQVIATVGPNGVVWTVARPPYAIEAAALGWLIGSVAQVLLLIPGLRGSKLRLNFNWRHPALRQILRLYAPVMFVLVIDTLVVRTFSYNLASQTIVGALGYMNWATTLIQFPQGLVAAAISVAILPTLSQQSVLIALENDMAEDDATAALAGPSNPMASQSAQAFKDTLGLGLRLSITLILPAAVGLFVLAVPIVALLFQRGAFGPADTEITATALRLYLIGLPFAAVDLLFVYAFYARQDTLTPAIIGLVSFGVYMVAAVLLLPSLGLFSLMVADSLKHITHAIISAIVLRRRIGGFGKQRIGLTLLKTGIAVSVMGVVALGLDALLEPIIGIDTFFHRLLIVGLITAACAVAYFGAAALLRIDELRWLAGLLKRRLIRH
ncbi:MAG: murein biosynthesis integral membrane protein MurJ [Anaerolineae bacterium]